METRELRQHGYGNKHLMEDFDVFHGQAWDGALCGGIRWDRCWAMAFLKEALQYSGLTNANIAAKSRQRFPLSLFRTGISPDSLGGQCVDFILPNTE